MEKSREKKVVKPSPTKPTSPTTRGSTRSITKKAKEQAKEKDDSPVFKKPKVTAKSKKKRAEISN